MRLSRVALVGLLFVAARSTQGQETGSSSVDASPASSDSPTISFTQSTTSSKTTSDADSTTPTKGSSSGPAPVQDVIQAAIDAGATPQQAAVIAVAADTGASFDTIVQTAVQ
ncbi:hypothetical protein THRCLA_23053, partial [Thraustotheca clavata]